MHLPHETHHKEKVGSSSRKSMGLTQWRTLLLCLLILSSVVMFTKYHQAHSMGGNTSTLSKNIEQLEGRLAQANQPMTRSTDKLANVPSIWPTKGTVTSVFGWRNSPLASGRELHSGIDIANTLGTPIVATADGEVIQSGWSEGYGNIVEINHGNGITTIYGHNSQIAVSVGQSVRKGQVISFIGSTGRSTGPHLHYEVRVNGTAVDPIKFLILY